MDVRRLVKRSELGDSERTLLDAMQVLNFGRIENLFVRDGRPVFNPSPRIIAAVKMSPQTTPREERQPCDFELKQEVVLLLRLLRRVGNGNILLIQIRHGLPSNVEIEQPIATLGVRS